MSSFTTNYQRRQHLKGYMRYRKGARRFLICTMLVLFTLLSPPLTSSSSAATPGLLLSYPFNGDAADASGNGNNGTVNGATPTTDRFGNGNSAYSFDGINDSVTGSVPVSSSVTVSLWAKSATAVWNANGFLASSRDPNGFIIHPTAGGTKWTGYIVDNSGNFYAIGTHRATAITDYHQYAITYDNTTGDAQMFFDGQSVVKRSLLGIMTRAGSGTLNLSIGADSNGYASPYGAAAIDDVRIYNRALSGAEVTALFRDTPAQLPVNGACGTSGDETFATPPSTNLCFSGTASGITGDGPWSWTCTGSSGTTATCSALFAGPLDTVLNSTGMTFTTGGAAPWFGQSLVTHDGTGAARSGAVGNNQESWMETTITGPAALSFWWKVSSQAAADFLRFSIDGNEITGISGTVDWAQATGISVPAGTHTLTWSYAKNGAGVSGDDAGWVDQLEVTTGICGSSNGGNFTSAPRTNLCSAGSPSGVTGTGPWNWSCAGGNGKSASCSAFVAPTLAEAMNTPGMTYTTDGDTPWFGETQVSHDGVSAARSGPLDDNQVSRLKSTITGPAVLSFWWKVSSEEGFDFLRFYVDGNEIAVTSGEKEWAQVTGISIPSGAHTITWTYEKDEFLSSGDDAGWVDQLEVVSGACGSSNGAAFTSAPTANLCFSSTPSDVTGSGPWNWTCSNGSGMAASCSAFVALSLAEALNTTGIAYATGGAAPWFGQTTTSHDGTGAARSGAVTNGKSWLKTGITGPVALSFWWKISSQDGSDTLQVHLDGVPLATIGGTTDWTQTTGISIPPGTHTVEWLYTKNGSSSSIDDAAWLDQVDVINGACGSSNGASFTSAPTTDLCFSSNVSDFSGSGPWSWKCTGSNGIATTCSASNRLSLAEALNTTGITYSTSGAAPWFGQSLVSYDGTGAARSGSIDNAQTSDMSATITGPATLSFWWKVSSEKNHDYLRCLVDGVEVAGISGALEWTEITGITLPSGTHTVTWSYGKDDSLSAGDDGGWVDGIVINGVCGGSGAAFSTPSTDLCAVGTPSGVTGTGPWQWNCAGSYDTAHSCSAARQLSLEEALNTTGTSFTTGISAAPWFGQSAVSHDGTGAARSGAVNDSQESRLEMTVTASGTLSFWWKVSSREGYDYLSFYLDGNEIAKISGSLDWTQVTGIAIPPGSHTVTWSYGKNGSLASGDNAGWVDQITWQRQGVCGASNGATLISPPATDLCESGTPSAVTGVGPWRWSCQESNSSSCIALSPDTVTVPVATEDFEAPLPPLLPTGWLSSGGTGGATWATHTGTRNPSGIPAYSGAKLIYFNSYEVESGSATLVSPPFAMNGGGIISFWMYRDEYPAPDLINVYTNSSATLSGATYLGTFHRDITYPPTVSSSDWYQVTVGIPATITGPENYLLIEGVSANGYDLHLDDITVSSFSSTRRLSITLSGAGAGMVNSTPAGIACSGGTCQYDFPLESSVTLLQTASATSLFGSWSAPPCTIINGRCILTLDVARSVTATFDLAPKAKIGDTGYGTLADAADAASPSEMTTIMLLADILPLPFKITKQFSLKGGYPPLFDSQSGYTVLMGQFIIGNGGKGVMDRVVVR
jgi:Concanavalin A-like lectin/glucanases superfamily